MFWQIVVVSSFLKLLLLPCYTSTDFEVHRNWLAITHSLPIEEWYRDARSPWTLDYPPLFAWFEWFLSHLAHLIDSDMLQVDNLNYKSFETLLFQRLSVIISDLVLALGIKMCVNGISESKATVLLFSLTFNAGLVFVDHIHFQYNGLLLGLLLCSVGSMLTSRPLWSAAIFVLLLNMKHIFLYSAPAYFVYLLAYYVCCGEGITKIRFLNLMRLCMIVIIGFALSFGPFIGQLATIGARLFPFKRGLTHAYWAPNFWALYCFLDRILGAIAKHLDPGRVTTTAGSASGLVQETTFTILPNVHPAATFILTIFATLPSLIELFRRPEGPVKFLRVLILCNFSSFFFGWHVHEKAALLVSIPWTILAAANPTTSVEGRLFLLVNNVANFSLFPLLFREEETSIKVFIFLFNVCFVIYHLQQPQLKYYEFLYLLGLGPIFLFPYIVSLIYPFLLMQFQFLPLLAYSVYCSLGNAYVYYSFYSISMKGQTR